MRNAMWSPPTPQSAALTESPAQHKSEALVRIGPALDLAERRRSVVVVDGSEYLVIFGRRRFTVLDNRCPHMGSRLDHAKIARSTLTCPTHSYRYSLADGAAVHRR